MRRDGRENGEKRKVSITRDYLIYPEGSVLIEVGRTKVICSAFVEEKVPHFLKGTDSGWITAEYSMLPGSTQMRKIRDSSRGKVDGRTHEIQRLIGRSLRSVVNLKKMGERTIWIDCDVIQADGGTRTASITGSFIALMLAFKKLKEKGLIEEIPVMEYVAAISVGVVDEEAVLDLCYEEDSSAKVDMNLVMTDKGKIIEIQGTGEESSFSRAEMNQMIDLAEMGINELINIQKEMLEEK